MADSLVDRLLRMAAEHRGVAGDSGEAIVVGLLGRGIQSSRTPAMHEREAWRLGIGYSYLLLDFDLLMLPDAALGEVLDAFQTAGFRGVNVTHPMKQAVAPLVDDITPDAAAIGAINTVVFSGGRKKGYNTDAWGFAQSFRKTMNDVARQRVAMFGAGGAGAAVAYALMELGAGELAVIDSDAARAERLARRMETRFPGRIVAAHNPGAALAAADGIVNTTPVGMDKYPGTPFDTTLLAPGQWVADIIYFPTETELLRCARAIGCRTLPGDGMAIGQAVRAFELFTGVKPDSSAMAHHFEAAA